ncbi:uncharacterized protein O3C94_007281 [Discoglossus pictus]
MKMRAESETCLSGLLPGGVACGMIQSPHIKAAAWHPQHGLTRIACTDGCTGSASGSKWTIRRMYGVTINVLVKYWMDFPTLCKRLSLQTAPDQQELKISEQETQVVDPRTPTWQRVYNEDTRPTTSNSRATVHLIQNQDTQPIASNSRATVHLIQNQDTQPIASNNCETLHIIQSQDKQPIASNSRTTVDIIQSQDTQPIASNSRTTVHIIQSQDTQPIASNNRTTVDIIQNKDPQPPACSVSPIEVLSFPVQETQPSGDVLHTSMEESNTSHQILRKAELDLSTILINV